MSLKTESSFSSAEFMYLSMRPKETLAWTIMEMIMGSMDMGNLRMLNREMETKAFSGSKLLLESERT